MTIYINYKMNAQQINTIRLYAKQNPIMWNYLYDRMVKKVKYEVLEGTPPPNYKEALKIKIKHYKFKDELLERMKDKKRVEKENNENINKKLEEQFNKMKEKLEEENSNNFELCNICYEEKDPFYMVKCPNKQHNIGCLECAGRCLHSKTYGRTHNISCPYCREELIFQTRSYFPTHMYRTYKVNIDKEYYNSTTKQWTIISTQKDRTITYIGEDDLGGGKYKLNFKKNFSFNNSKRKRRELTLKINDREYNKFKNEEFKKTIYINKYEEGDTKYRFSFKINVCFDNLVDKEIYKNKPKIDLERIKKYCGLNSNEWIDFDRYHLKYNS